MFKFDANHRNARIVLIPVVLMPVVLVLLPVVLVLMPVVLVLMLAL